MLAGDSDFEIKPTGGYERKVRSWGFPCLVSPFLTGNPSKGEPQVEHLFKRAMTSANYETMGLDELRQYVLTHRENIQAFHVYVDRFSF